VEERHDDVTPLLREAEALLEVRRYDDAIERARHVVGRAPEDARGYQVWSRALAGQDQFAEAAHLASESIRLAPHDPMGYRLRSRALASQARHERPAGRAHLAADAAEAARMAVQLAPHDPNGHLVLAESLSLGKDYQGANREMQEAIRLAPSSVATWVTASLIAIGAKNWAGAIDACHRALAIDPNNYAALNNLGVALRASGQRAEGTQALARAASVEPDSTTARKNLSRAGIRIARIAVLVVLIPIGFVAHVGLVLYLVFAFGSNILISRRPDLVLRAERWAAPLALLFARRRKKE
jgi:tetratricopeptide (TPR) repeat protein